MSLANPIWGDVSSRKRVLGNDGGRGLLVEPAASNWGETEQEEAYRSLRAPCLDTFVTEKWRIYG